jgi:putative SOS response-associated peptidase YedK
MVCNWQVQGVKQKEPYAIADQDAELFEFTGFWGLWTDKVNERLLENFAVISAKPNDLIEPIHNRMSAILKPDDSERWLAAAEQERLPIDLHRPFPAGNSIAWKVSNDVGFVRNNRPELVDQIK